MNSLYGAIGTTVVIVLLFCMYLMLTRKTNNKPMIVSQSMLQYRYSNRQKNSRKLNVRSQSKVHHDKTNIRVIIVENNAYWIKDNIFYKAPLVNELIDKESAEQVDTISMDKVQLDKMLFIMDKLREGINDDSRGSGNK
jgi:hypothetical protein